MDTMIVSALVGVVVGGAGHAAWSTWMAQRSLVRETRVEIFRELLPTVYDDNPSQPRAWCDPHAKWEQLFRAARLLGGRDWQRTAMLRSSVLRWHEQELLESEGDGEAVDEQPWVVVVRRNLTDYEVWLHRRLSGWRRRPHPLLQ